MGHSAQEVIDDAVDTLGRLEFSQKTGRDRIDGEHVVVTVVTKATGRGKFSAAITCVARGSCSADWEDIFLCAQRKGDSRSSISSRLDSNGQAVIVDLSPEALYGIRPTLRAR